jgi:flagellar biosynthesis protein FliP
MGNKLPSGVDVIRTFRLRFLVFFVHFFSGLPAPGILLMFTLFLILSVAFSFLRRFYCVYDVSGKFGLAYTPSTKA